jgi:penicillin amidase
MSEADLSKPRRRRWVILIGKITAAVVALLLLAGVGGFYWLFIRPLPVTQGEIQLSGLTAQVQVIRDQHGIPHIFAQNRADALQALGFLHASERLFQMELNRRAGQGRLAEVLGKDRLGIDKFTRTLGVYALAQQSFERYSPEAQALFQAYAAGVNAWLQANQNRLPAEFLLLGIKPEPWQPADSVVWGKLMALQLSKNMALEKLRARLQGRVDPKVMPILFPGLNLDDPVTTQPRALQKAEQDVYEQLGTITGLAHGASNEWAISGALTSSGKPILANDPHLSLEAPILWYLARIVLPDDELKGASIPGLPGLLLGQNNAIAWGMTTTGSDVQDLFVETLAPNDTSSYQTPQGNTAFTTRTETIAVKGSAPVTFTVRSTRHGPVLSDIDPALAQLAGEGKVVALSFTALRDDDRTGEAIVAINAAQNWDEFNTALSLYQAPPQNLIYADRVGNIGFVAAGMVPVRKHGSGEGLVPADGAAGADDWVGFVPPNEWPRRFNPSAGYIFNANNAVTGPGFMYWYGADYEETFRARRLQELFDQGGRHDLDRSAAMQADHLSLAARELVPFLLKIQPQDDRQRQALALLAQWDFVMDQNRPEPLIFEAWLYQLNKVLFPGKLGEDLAEKSPLKATQVTIILDNSQTTFCPQQDIICGAEMRQALVDALSLGEKLQGHDMAQWRWGQEHRATLTHKVYSHVPVLKNLTDLSVPSSGGFYTLDRGGSFAMEPPDIFARNHGGGYRAIYDLADPAASRFMITTGQSGHIFSPYYGNLVDAWNKVQSINLTGQVNEILQQNGRKLTLSP